MVGQHAVVGQCDVLLLPLLVQGFSTSLQKDPLEDNKIKTILLYFVFEAAVSFHRTTPPHKHT